MSTQTIKRGDHVRVTIEGDVRLSRSGAVQVETGDAQRFTLDATGEGVSVERLSRAYQWSAGDVVQESTPTGILTYERGNDGHWFVAGSALRFSDAEVTGSVDECGARVLRYQAGDDA